MCYKLYSSVNATHTLSLFISTTAGCYAISDKSGEWNQQCLIMIQTHAVPCWCSISFQQLHQNISSEYRPWVTVRTWAYQRRSSRKHKISCWAAGYWNTSLSSLFHSLIERQRERENRFLPVSRPWRHLANYKATHSVFPVLKVEDNVWSRWLSIRLQQFFRAVDIGCTQS